MIRVHSISLGCPKNRVDTEHLLGSVPGVVLVPSPAESDLVLINTCGFMAPAITESVRVICDAIEDVREAQAGKKPLLAVAGCLVGRFGEATLSPDLPEVDLWLDNRDLAAWPEKLAQRLGVTAAAGAAPRLVSTPPSFAWLKISDGCDHTCAFCTIPSIRGPFRSTPSAILEVEARSLLDRGARELILIAQDTAAWGKDIGETHGLRALLDRILPLDGLERLRILYLYPAGLSRDLLGYLREAGRVFMPYFDVPLQHAHPDILTRMGRPFARNPRAVVERIREYFPDAALRTSLIAGFPGETEEHFDYLTRFVDEVRFHHLGVFAFQAEEGTPAASLPDQVPDRVKEWRKDSLMLLQSEISEDILARYVGQRMEVLVDEPHPEWPGLFTGRTWFQAPEIDGVTYVSGPGVTAGAMVAADITESQTYDLVALT